MSVGSLGVLEEDELNLELRDDVVMVVNLVFRSLSSVLPPTSDLLIRRQHRSCSSTVEETRHDGLQLKKAILSTLAVQFFVSLTYDLSTTWPHNLTFRMTFQAVAGRAV